MLLLRDQQRFDFLSSVVARREHGFHHQTRLLEHLVARVFLQEAIGEIRGEQTAGAEHEKENKGELG
jgi:hypothetical protein